MIKALVVDDSHFFRRRIIECLNLDPEIEVIGEACDGHQAIEQAEKLKPDVITMDIEMPNMDGIKAVKNIMEKCPVPILMFSSLTKEGATATLAALDAGAADFLLKEFKTLSFDKDVAIGQLCERVKALASKNQSTTTSKSKVSHRRNEAALDAQDKLLTKDIGLAVIGASTGGPAALENVLKKLPASYFLPVILIQHMPATFTQAFADRLNTLCAVTIKEAEHGDVLKAGTVYVAPGGKQTYVRKNGRDVYLEIGEAPPEVTYKPCIDITFNSIANSFNKKVLAIVMTGMGSDGCAGASFLKQKGAIIWSQDEASSIVYGMPMAVAKANLADRILGLEDIGRKLASLK